MQGIVIQVHWSLTTTVSECKSRYGLFHSSGRKYPKHNQENGQVCVGSKFTSIRSGRDNPKSESKQTETHQKQISIYTINSSAVNENKNALCLQGNTKTLI